MRTQKTVVDEDTTTTYKYTWNGSNLTHQSWGSKYIHFYYDNSGSVLGFTYFNGTSSTDYTYAKNMQGDVIGIVDSAGATVATYTYDAWGNILTATGDLAEINPIRYRGYYYDDEINMYYLQSRYYDQNVGRFINADDANMILFLALSGMIGVSLFDYCENNVINYIDPTGYVVFTQTTNYYCIKLNNWETELLLSTVGITATIATVVIAIIAAIPSLGISTGVASAIVACVDALVEILKFMNYTGGNKGLNINISHEWFCPHYIWINKKEPKGFKSVWAIWNAIKENVKKIFKIVSVKIIKKISEMKTKTERIVKLCKMIYDYYCGKKITKKKYA